MALTPGTRFGAYAIAEAIGAGGMGEVYRARDQTLERDVAIKVLPPSFALDENRVARFEQEAKTLASLNHVNIAHIYGLERSDGVTALAMELVEGPTLAERIEQGPIPPDEALNIARQIADGLEAAHARGIVHRDLKPANIKLATDGTVKVLDFGIAKALDTRVTSGPQSPALTTPAMTEAGIVLGTAQYMSPEQARGKQVDQRADIWAFGCVLYEMLTGQPAFGGEDVTMVLARVLERGANLDALPATIQPAVRQAISLCLQKDPKKRVRDIGDVKLALEGAFETAAPQTDAALSSPRPPLGWLVAVGVAVALVTAAGVWTFRPSGQPTTAAIARVTVTLPAGDALNLDMDGPALALSPDGTTLVYTGLHENTQQLFVRPLDSVDAKPLPGTDGAFSPFFSPDGQWVGFFAEGKLKKAAVAGGAVQVLADASGPRGGSWGPDDTIYFTPVANTVSGIWKVSAAGGAASEVTQLDPTQGEISHRWPQVLPGGKALLFSVRTGPAADETRAELLILQSGERRVLAEGAETGRYVSTGHLVYAKPGADTLVAVPMNLDRLEVAKTAPVVLAEQVRVGGEGAVYAVSDAGHLVYARGSAKRLDSRLVWVDRRGGVETVPVPTRQYRSVALSPDGRLAALGTTGTAYDIWIYDFARSTLTKLTADGSSQRPVWAPDGAHVAYRADRAGSRNLFWISVDSTGPEERLTTGESTESPSSFSPDGKLLAFSLSSEVTGGDIWVVPLDGDRTPRGVVVAEADQRHPQFSPDGRWLAYTSTESGQTEVYVQPFPGPGRKWLVSTDGGTEPRWSRDGGELFYRNGYAFMAVDVNTQSAFSAGSPRLLFQRRGVISGSPTTEFDVSLDGQRFLMVEPVEAQSPVTQIDVVMNWFTELTRLVPTE
jgi:Tol biopolymer transport system component